jgi:hypothetical protein
VNLLPEDWVLLAGLAVFCLAVLAITVGAAFLIWQQVLL